MSATVILSTGVEVSYPMANWVQWQSDGTAKLFQGNRGDEENSLFIARAPAGSIVSFCEPNAVHCHAPRHMTLDAALDIVRHSIPSIDTYPRMKRLAEIKRLLKRLDGRSISWKESDE